MDKNVCRKDTDERPTDRIPCLCLWYPLSKHHQMVQQNHVSYLVHYFKSQDLSVRKWLELAEVADVDHAADHSNEDLVPKVSIKKYHDQRENQSAHYEPKRVEECS